MIPKINPKNYVKLFSIKESVLLSYAEILQRQKMKKDAFPNIELIYIDGQWFFNKIDLAKYNYSDQKIIKVINLVENRAAKYLNASEKFKRDFSRKDWKNLAKPFNEYYKIWNDYLRIVDIPVYITYHFEKRLMKAVVKAGLKSKDFDILTYPLYNTYNLRRKNDLLLLPLGKIKKAEFRSRWAWSINELAAFKTLNDSYLKEQLSAIKNAKKELEEGEKHRQQSKEKYYRLYNKLSVNLRRKADIAQKLVYIRDFRFEQFLRGIYNFYPLFKEISRRLNLSCDELIHLTPQEILAKKIPADLTLRQRRYVNIKNKIYTGQAANQIYQLFNKTAKDQNQVSGQGVSAGVVRGIAKVVLSTKEFNKVKKGDIIICEITTPDYMPVLHKVSAIVADIGGFTSHSAIVAREMKIPCVVGTEIATKVFKDGDLIEVDANKGVIKKLK